MMCRGKQFLSAPACQQRWRGLRSRKDGENAYADYIRKQTCMEDNQELNVHRRTFVRITHGHISVRWEGNSQYEIPRHRTILLLTKRPSSRAQGKEGAKPGSSFGAEFCLKLCSLCESQRAALTYFGAHSLRKATWCQIIRKAIAMM